MTDKTTYLRIRDEQGIHYISIMGTNGMLAKINTTTGEIEYGEHYTPDETARTFWESFGTLPAKIAEAIAENERLRAELGRPEKSIDELIDASSLGTPEVKAIRAQAPPEVTDKVMGLLRENERKKVAEYDRALSQSIELKAELRKVGIMSDDGGLTWHCLCCTGSWKSDDLEEHEGDCLAKLNFGTETVEWNDGEKPINISFRHPFLFLVWPAEDLPGEWIADCPGINAISQGGSPDEAFRSLMEVVAITVELDKRQGQDPEDRAFVLPGIQEMLDDIKIRELETDRQGKRSRLNIVPEGDED